MIRTATGRKIRFATDRRIRFGEVYEEAPSQAYNLTAGEFGLDDKDNTNTKGVLFRAAQLIINRDGGFQYELLDNPWQLVAITDRKTTD